MAADQAQAACAAHRDVPSGPATAQQDCADVLHISVFFDGTGNNKDVDEATQKWSNVARMYYSALMRAESGSNNYAVYISGVGTPFNGKPLSAADQVMIDLEDGMPGSAGGSGGSRRLDWGQQQVNDALRDVLLSRAKTLGQTVQKYAKSGQQQSFAEVATALAKHRLIKQINVSVFGFSRGAALARAFCNQWLWQCENNRGRLLYEGHPIRFAFLGLFDTVASFGLASTNLANEPQWGGFKGRDLVVDDRIERCVHFVAAHEQRFSFPVDLIRRDGKTDNRWLEVTYPGVHSDIGGGYEPNEQGVSNNYARIPMRDMMVQASIAGARLLRVEEIEARRESLYAERFECLPATEIAYQAYRSQCNPRGSIEQQFKAHMSQLYRAYGTLHRRGVETVTQRMHRTGQSWAFGPDDMASELDSYRKAVHDALRPPTPWSLVDPSEHALRVKAGLYALWISPKRWQVEAWSKTASAGMANFVNSFIHDSKVGFLKNGEPFSYFSERGIGESRHSIQGWFDEHVSRPVDHAAEATVDYTKQKAQQAKQAASDAADAVERKATETADAIKKKTTETYQEVKRTVSDTVEAAERKASETYQSVKREAGQAIDSLERQANSAMQQADASLKSAGQKASELTHKALESLSDAWKYLPGP